MTGEQRAIRKIGVFTSGGDSPGMNACIRAVVRAALYYKVEVVGICRGYEGMIEGSFLPLPSRSVSNIIQRGGTILKSARSKRFLTPEGRQHAYEQLKLEGIDALVAIGGDGTFRGAKIFYDEHQVPAIGIPGTIDNDLYGTDYTVGYDTAINTAVQAIDKIRDTADAHDRLFFIEVMGRDAGFIAMRSGIGGGAEAVLIPESRTSVDEVVDILNSGYQRNKSSSIVVVAEGDEEGGAMELADKIRKKFDTYDTRVTILGHIQRGGNPTCMDRVLASRLGVAAVEALLNGQKNEMVGVVNKEITFTHFDNATKHHQQISKELLNLVKILAG